MAILFANNAYGTLSGSISATATTINLGTGQGARFPSPTNPDYFLATLIGIDGNGNENSWEIVKVTGRTNDALTVVRGQESTTAAIWAAGTRLELRITKGSLDLFTQGVLGTDVQAYDGDLAAIAALAGTSGFLKKTAANTWSLDTSTYITGNQSITLSGDATGSGSTAITVTLATVTAAKGGTGQTSYAVGDLLYASGTSALSKLAGVATGNALISGGVATAPSWGKIGLTTHVSGTLGVANGGTGVETLTGLVKASGTSAFSAAVAGTDYVTPTGTENLSNKTISSSTLTSPTINNQITIGGSLSNGELGPRVFADFSNASVNLRAMFQSSTTNGNTTVSAIPNGTATVSQFALYSSSSPTNSSFLGIQNNGTTNQIISNKSGTGSTLPLLFMMDGAEAARLDTAGNLVLSKSYVEKVFTITDGASVDINPANGTIQLWTLGASRTPTASSFADGQSVTLLIDDGTAFAVTWTTIGVTWKTNGGSAPTLQTTGRTAIALWKAGGTVYGARVGDA